VQSQEKIPGSTPLTLQVYMNFPEIAHYSQEVSDPHSPNYRHFLTTAQLVKKFHLNVLLQHNIHALKKLGFTHVAADGLSIQATGTAQLVNTVFHTTMMRGQIADKKTVRHVTYPARNLTVPSSLTSIMNIGGLFTGLPIAVPQIAGHVQSPRALFPFISHLPNASESLSGPPLKRVSSPPAPSSSSQPEYTYSVTQDISSSAQMGLPYTFTITLYYNGSPVSEYSAESNSGYTDNDKIEYSTFGSYQGGQMNISEAALQSVSSYVLDMELTVSGSNIGYVKMPAITVSGSSADMTPSLSSWYAALGATQLIQKETSASTVPVVGIIAAAQPNVTDLKDFEEKYGLPSNSTVVAYGTSAGSGGSAYQQELELDMESVEKASPGATLEIYIMSDNSSGPLSAFNAIASQNSVDVVNCSYSFYAQDASNGSSFSQSLQQSIENGINEGITYCAAAG
ncbi:MAG: protease pro-enzyme activation domain-containing protein, partial [Firmicutes bacterium]|nr:protease pro-enzyme activation domain-containing protein [Bacillota bacterium]